MFTLKVQVDSVLTDIVPQQLHHEGNALRDDGGLVSALPARLGETLEDTQVVRTQLTLDTQT